MRKIFFTLSLTLLVFSRIFAQPAVKTFTPGSFTKLDVSNAFEVDLQSSNEEKVIVECTEELMNKVEVNVKSNELVIRLKPGNYDSPGKHKATVYYKTLNEIEVSGAVSIKTLNKIESRTLKIDMSGAASGKLEIQSNDLEVEMSGASSLSLSGNIKTQDVDISGASSYKSFDLESEVCILESSGASKAQVFVKNEIKGEASGASSIKYKGDPKRVMVDASGASSVKSSK